MSRTHIVTNWENDMLAEPEEKVVKFVQENYPDYELQLLSGLKHRDIQDIYESLRDSRVIIMQLSLLDKTQIANIVKQISHPIHVNNNGAERRYDIMEFIFLSSHPFEDFYTVMDACSGVVDNHGENSLSKILFNCECHFWGFDGKHYEMRRNNSFGYTYAIRHS